MPGVPGGAGSAIPGIRQLILAGWLGVHVFRPITDEHAAANMVRRISLLHDQATGLDRALGTISVALLQLDSPAAGVVKEFRISFTVRPIEAGGGLEMPGCGNTNEPSFPLARQWGRSANRIIESGPPLISIRDEPALGPGTG